MVVATLICFRLLKSCAAFALSFALLNAGSSSPARIAIMAMTTKSSIKVKPWGKQTGRPWRGALIFSGRKSFVLDFKMIGQSPIQLSHHEPLSRRIEAVSVASLSPDILRWQGKNLLQIIYRWNLQLLPAAKNQTRIDWTRRIGRLKTLRRKRPLT